ncbi:MAG: tol-pal system protein YbgF [Vicinamibacteria bacterium]
MTAHPSAFARALAALALLVLAAALPAAAASKEIERLQVQVAGLQGQLVSLQRAVEDTAREMKRLSELVAEQNATTRRGVQEQRSSNEALQASLREVVERLGEISEQLQASRLQAPPVLSDGSPAGGAPQPGLANAPAPRELYSQAYADFARGNYDIAIQGFQEYLRNYPDTDFADNAQYWVGECLYGKQKFDDAIEAWKALIRDYASSDKLPDARVKMGMALEKLGRRSQALLEYRFVVERYPNSPAARIARDKLNP